MRHAVRVIACLDVAGVRVVKGVGFSDLRDAGDPVERARHYDASGADEIVILDITASADARVTTYDMVRRTADQVFIPLTVGGGVRSVGDVDLLLRAGADKVSVGTAAVLRPELVGKVADRFGSQVLVVSVDARRSADIPSGFEVTTHGGRRSTGLDALAWVEEAPARGAGEVLLNSMDADGSGAGFDTELIAAAREVTTVPLVASGGAGAAGHFPPAAAAGADAVLAAGIFHRGEVGITEVKAALSAAGHRVRPPSTAAR